MIRPLLLMMRFIGLVKRAGRAIIGGEVDCKSLFYVARNADIF